MKRMLVSQQRIRSITNLRLDHVRGGAPTDPKTGQSTGQVRHGTFEALIAIAPE